MSVWLGHHVCILQKSVTNNAVWINSDVLIYRSLILLEVSYRIFAVVLRKWDELCSSMLVLYHI